MADEWGPLGALIGDWENKGRALDGVDVSYSHERERVWNTPYRERASLKPFGPVVNGSQSLYGLDYRSAMWRGEDVEPFHAEVGYWLWDSATGEILRAFVLGRGISVLAGGITTADATSFTMSAGADGSPYRIGENSYLADHASTVSYEITVTLHEDDSWTYAQNSVLRMDQVEGLFAHTDSNHMVRTEA
jgi:hypothetical protein